MPQRYNFPQSTQLGNVADPTLQTDAATKQSSDITAFAPSQAATNLATLLLAAGVGSNALTVNGNVVSLLPDGTRIKFADAQIYTVSSATFGGGTSFNIAPTLQASTGAQAAGAQVLYFAQGVGQVIKSINAGTNVTFSTTGSGLTISSTGGGGGGGLTDVILNEPNWRSVNKSTVNNVETLTVTDNAQSGTSVFAGSFINTIGGTSLSGVVNPAASDGASITFAFNTSTVTLPAFTAGTYPISGTFPALDLLSIIARDDFKNLFFGPVGSRLWTFTIDASGAMRLAYSGKDNFLISNTIPNPTINLTFGGTWSGLTLNDYFFPLSITSSGTPSFRTLNSGDVIPAVSGTPANGQVPTYNLETRNLVWGTGSGGVAITSPSNTLTVGGTTAAPTLDVAIPAETTRIDGRIALNIGSATQRTRLSQGTTGTAVTINQVVGQPVQMTVTVTTDATAILATLNAAGSNATTISNSQTGGNTLLVQSWSANVLQIIATFPSATTIAQVQALFSGARSDSVFYGGPTTGQFTFVDAPKAAIANQFFAGANITLTQDASRNVTIASTGGGSSGVIFDVASAYNADNAGVLTRINSLTPLQSAATGSITNITDFGSVNITSTPFPPPITAGYNTAFIGISASDESWGGVGRLTATGLDQIAWKRRPASTGSFTGARLWQVINNIASVYSGVDLNTVQASTGPVTSVLFPELTHTYGEDQLGGKADTVTAQPFVDSRIATKIGSAPSSTTYTSSGAQTVGSGFGNAGTTATFITTSYATAKAFLQTAAIGAIPPGSGTGNWTLPSWPILISNIANPTSTQFATVTLIQEASATSFLSITMSGNAPYFAGFTTAQTLYFLGDTSFVFQSPPTIAIQKFTVASLNGLQGVGNLTSSDNTIGITKTGQAIDLKGVATGGGAGVATGYNIGDYVQANIRTYAGGSDTTVDTQNNEGSIQIGSGTGYSTNSQVIAKNTGSQGWSFGGQTVNNFVAELGAQKQTFRFGISGNWNINGLLPYSSSPNSGVLIPPIFIKEAEDYNSPGAQFPGFTPNGTDYEVFTATSPVVANARYSLDLGKTVSAISTVFATTIAGGNVLVVTVTVNNVTNITEAGVTLPLEVFIGGVWTYAGSEWLISSTTATTLQLTLNTNLVQLIIGDQVRIQGGGFTTPLIWWRAGVPQANTSFGTATTSTTGNGYLEITIAPNSWTLDSFLYQPTGFTLPTSTSRYNLTWSAFMPGVVNVNSTQYWMYNNNVDSFYSPAALTQWNNRFTANFGGVSSLQTLQQVVNVGNSINNTSPNVGSIQILDSVSNKTTTLDGTRVKAQSLVLDGSTLGSLTLKTAATTTSYPITLPATQASTNTVGHTLVNPGTGNLSWAAPNLTVSTNTAWVSSTYTTNAAAAIGDTIVQIATDVTSFFTAGVNISFVSGGSPQYVVTASSFSGGNTTLTLLAPLTAAVSSGTLIYAATLGATNFNRVNVSTNLVSSVANGVLNLASTASGSGSSGTTIYVSIPFQTNVGNGAPGTMRLRALAGATLAQAQAFFPLNSTFTLSFWNDQTTRPIQRVNGAITSPSTNVFDVPVDNIAPYTTGTGVVAVRQNLPFAEFDIPLVYQPSNAKIGISADNTISLSSSTGALQVAQQGATNGQALVWKGTTWLPGEVSGSLNPPIFITGSGAPADNLGLVGQYYVDTSVLTPGNGIWLKTQVTTSPYWLRQTNFENALRSYNVTQLSFSFAKVAATSAITLSGLQTIDGVSVIAGDIVLVAGQSVGTQANNGLYTASATSWVRVTTPQIIQGLVILISQGTANAGNSFIQTSPMPNGTLYSDPQTWSIFAANGAASLQATTQVGSTTTNGISVGGALTVGYTSGNTANTVVLTGATAGSNPAVTALGVDTNVGLTIAGKGTGKVIINSSSDIQGNVTLSRSSSNYFQITGGVTGGAPRISVAGTTDVNVDLQLSPLGTGSVRALSALSANFAITASNTSANQLVLAGSVSGSPATITASGTDTNISVRINPKGAGATQIASDLFVFGASSLGSNSVNYVQVSGSATIPTVSSVGSVATNVDLRINAAGTGNLYLGNIVAYTGITISGNLTTSAEIVANGAGANVDLNLKSKATGVVNISSSDSTLPGVSVGGSATTGTQLSAINGNANSNIQLLPKGSGNTILGDGSTYTALQVTNGVTSYTQIQPYRSGILNLDFVMTALGTGSLYLGGTSTSTRPVLLMDQNSSSQLNLTALAGATDVSIAFTPKGGGDLYPIGFTLSATATNQPAINVASAKGSTTLGPGTAGQVLTSNGTAGAPYWSGAGLSGANMTVLTAGGSASSASAIALTSQFNNLGLTFPATNQLTGFVANATYQIDITFGWAPTVAAAANAYMSLTTTSSIVVNPTYGTGASVANNRQANIPAGDTTIVTAQGYYTTNATPGTLYAWYFVGVPGTISATTFTITRIA